jgi:hypothetical protein
MFNNDTRNRKLRITFGFIGGVERGVREKYTNFYIKYRPVLYFVCNNLFFSVLQLIMCHGLLTVEALLSMRHTTLGRTLFDEGSARRDASA